MSTKILTILSLKLGISSKHAILKAEEYKRLLDVKARSSSVFKVTDTCQAVICLDLATNELNLPFNKELAIRLSGIRRKLYTNAVLTYMRVLGIGVSSLTISDITQKFGCSQTTEYAERLLNSYERTINHSYDKADITRSKFALAAVYIACKKLKIKAGKRRFLEFGRISQITFDKICLGMEKQLDCISADKTNVVLKKSNAPKSFIELVEENLKDQVTAGLPNWENNREDEKLNYNYEEWKKKMLSDC